MMREIKSVYLLGLPPYTMWTIPLDLQHKAVFNYSVDCIFLVRCLVSRYVANQLTHPLVTYHARS